MHSLFRFGRVVNCILFVELNLLNLDQLQSHGQLTRKQGNFYGLGYVYDDIVYCTWVFHCISIPASEMISASSAAFRDFIDFFYIIGKLISSWRAHHL